MGTGAWDDHEIAPSVHAARYEEAAPGLARVLRSAAAEAAARAYEERDAGAVEAQEKFQRATRRARRSVLATGLAAALLLVLGTLSDALPRPLEQTLFVMFSLAATTAGAMASYWIRRIREGRLLERWMTRRADSETQRLRYFEAVTRGQRAEEPLLQLEYFRRYQLDVQRAYYDGQGKQHEVEADRIQARSSGAMAAAAIASGASGVLAATLGAAWAALAGLALAAQAVAAAWENGEATAQNRRNAERYERTRKTLDALYAQLDRVREAVAGGRLEALDGFVDSVHEQLSLEHRQWLEEIVAAGSAMERLEQLLSQYENDS
ncbi:MAG: hypothetical protein P8177_03515 [Gemmatimonadota bacterium]